MKNLFITFLVTAFLVFSVCIGVSIGAEKPFAQVETIDGEATVTHDAGQKEEKTEAVVKGMELQKNDVLKTKALATVTIMFKEDIKGSVAENTEIKISELFLKSKVESLKKGIKRPGAGATPAKIETTPIGGTRGTEEVEKKSKDPKNEHHWAEEVK